MAGRLSLQHAEDSGGRFQDQAFEPHSSFDFEDDLCNSNNNMNPMQNFDGSPMDFDSLDALYDENMDFGMFQDQEGIPMGAESFMPGNPNMNQMNMWQGANPVQNVPVFENPFGGANAPSQSAQSEIVNSRPDVNQHFGQITPPDDSTPESIGPPSAKADEDSTKSKEKDAEKLNRSQRARNAANKRHSKSKVARKDSRQDVGSEDSDDHSGQGKNTNQQREKNRIAAAKCRAKKKATSEVMQDSHREGAKANSALHREMRELRDQKAFLRNSLLQHEPGVCKCHAIHRFNMAQAQQMAFGVGASIGQPLSPSQNSASSAHTPGSDGSMGNPNPAPGPARPNNSNLGSLGSPLGYGLPMTGPAQDGGQMSQMSPDMSEFLQNPQEGHPGLQY